MLSKGALQDCAWSRYNHVMAASIVRCWHKTRVSFLHHLIQVVFVSIMLWVRVLIATIDQQVWLPSIKDHNVKIQASEGFGGTHKSRILEWFIFYLLPTPGLCFLFHWLIFLSDTVEEGVFLIQRSRTNHAHTAIQFAALSSQSCTRHMQTVRHKSCVYVRKSYVYLDYSNRKSIHTPSHFFIRKAQHGPSTCCFMHSLSLPPPGSLFQRGLTHYKTAAVSAEVKVVDGWGTDMLDNIG